jgi:hypothetical protein
MLHRARKAIWGAGFAIEIVSDHQKTAWNSKTKSDGQATWIKVGMWRSVFFSSPSRALLLMNLQNIDDHIFILMDLHFFLDTHICTWLRPHRFSRHPNFFGEMLLWLGLALACSGGLNVYGCVLFPCLSPFFFILPRCTCLVARFKPRADSLHGRIRIILAMVSPVWSSFFLIFTSLMLLEKRMDLKFGTNPAYTEHCRTTSVLIPWWPEKARAKTQ